jgi:hypothetical protein
MSDPVIEKAFDMNKPPLRVSNPGAVEGYQEYPRHLYQADGTYCSVGGDEEKDTKLSEGWSLTLAEAKEAIQVVLAAGDSGIQVQRRGPGRPKAN